MPKEKQDEYKQKIETLMGLIKQFDENTVKLKQSNDILQQKVEELKVELKEKNEELKRKNRLAVLGEMAACMAHEIRNPLGGLELSCSILYKELVADKQKKEKMNDILEGISHLKTIINDILTFSGNINPNISIIQLKDYLDNIINTLNTVNPNKVNIKNNIPAELTISADPNLINRVFTNILMNAMQAMEFNGNLEISSTQTNNTTSISFKDSGPGIPDELLDKLFIPFFSNSTGGTGLGLSIAQRIMDSHNGIIKAENNENNGAIFTVTFKNSLG